MDGLRISMCALAFLASPVSAQETDIAGKIALELNAEQTTDGACTLTFLITSGLTQPIDKVVYETVLFDTSGQVNRLTLFDFGALPPARPRVRQFAVPQLTCDQLGRVLFNGANTCEGEGLAADICDTGFAPTLHSCIDILHSHLSQV